LPVGGVHGGPKKSANTDFTKNRIKTKGFFPVPRVAAIAARNAVM